jgi:CRP-like cAMP-binding protein
MRAKKHRIKVKLTLPFHLIKLLKRKQHSVEDRGCLSSDRSIVLPDNIANLSPVPPLQDFPNSVKSLTNIEIPSSSSHREIVQEVEVSKDDHHFFEEFEAGKEILRRTGGILPLTMNQLDYFFQDGIFKHNLVATLTSGMMFGELGILMNKPRSATLVAKTSTHVAILKSEDYKLILKEAEMQKMEQRILFFM